MRRRSAFFFPALLLSFGPEVFALNFWAQESPQVRLPEWFSFEQRKRPREGAAPHGLFLVPVRIVSVYPVPTNICFKAYLRNSTFRTKIFEHRERPCEGAAPHGLSCVLIRTRCPYLVPISIFWRWIFISLHINFPAISLLSHRLKTICA